MSKLPSVSILIPTYNQSAYITKAIESAINQDYPNLQIIVIDDCSTDATEAIITQSIYISKIKYIKNEKNLGRVANYHNALYNHVFTDWVINLDGDDYYTNSNFISDAINTISKAKAEVLFFMGKHIMLESNKSVVFTSNAPIYVVRNALQFFTFFANSKEFSHMSLLYNTKLARESGFYEKEIISTDIFSLLKLCLNNKTMLTIQSTSISGCWVQHNSNTSKTKNFKQHFLNFKSYFQLFNIAHYQKVSFFKSSTWLLTITFRYFLFFLKHLITKN